MTLKSGRPETFDLNKYVVVIGDNLVNLHPEGKLVVEAMLGTPRMTVAYSVTNTGLEVRKE